MLAQTVVEFPLTETMKWIAGAIGFTCVGCGVLSFVILVKKVFGPHPPMDKKLEKLRREIYEVNGRSKKELAAAVKLIADDVGEIKIDRERKWKELTEEMHALANSRAFIKGKFEKRDHNS